MQTARVKIGLEKITLRLVEVNHYVTDTVELCKRYTNKNGEHFVASHRRVLFDFNQILHDGRGGQCDHFIFHKCLDPVNSLAAMGKKTKN